MKTFSPVRRRIGSEQRRERKRAGDEGEHDREQEPVEPDALVEELGDAHRQPESDEDDDLGEARQRRLEAPDLPPVRDVEVTERKPGDEDGQEARAVRDGRDAVDDPRRGERPERIEPLAREANAAHEERRAPSPGEPDREPDRHLQRRTP